MLMHEIKRQRKQKFLPIKKMLKFFRLINLLHKQKKIMIKNNMVISMKLVLVNICCDL